MTHTRRKLAHGKKGKSPIKTPEGKKAENLNRTTTGSKAGDALLMRQYMRANPRLHRLT